MARHFNVHVDGLKHEICPFRFSLGTRGNVDKYIKQFTEIFTENGRRAVKITEQVIGQKPTVTYTQAFPHTSTVTSTQSTISSVQAQNMITQATNLAASLAGQVYDISENLCRCKGPFTLSE